MDSQKIKRSESIAGKVAGYTRIAMDIIITVYLFFIIAVMPFYFQEGYNHIGSDKSYFFRTYTVYAAKILLPVLAVHLLCLFVDWLRSCKGRLPRECIKSGIENLRLSVTDLFAVGYAVSVCLSYLFSDYKETALWGASGWYMGTIPQLMLVGIYFAASRLWKRKNWMAYLFLPISAAVFVLGYLNRFGVWPIPMENAGIPAFISTIGNINWYCGYMVCVLFLGVGLFWMDGGEKRWRTVLLALYCFIGFATAVTQGSDSGLFALAAVALALFVLSAREAEEKPVRLLRFWQLSLLFAGACILTMALRGSFPGRLNDTSRSIDLLTNGGLPVLLAVFGCGAFCLARFQMKRQTMRVQAAVCYRKAAQAVCIAVPAIAIVLTGMILVNTLYPGCLGSLSDRGFFTFDANWGSHRGATWMAGWKCFASQVALHKLVGVGPDCMADYIYSGGNEELLQQVRANFGGNLLTNAHGEWLTILVCSGVFGAVCYAGVMVSAVIRLIRGRCQDAGGAVAYACGLCVLAYVCNHMWSFQQSMGVATVFVILGIGRRYEMG